MNKKEKTIWIISGIAALILVIFLTIKLVSVLNEDSNIEQDMIYDTTDMDENLDQNDQVLQAPENIIFPTDLVGTWLTLKPNATDEKNQYEGFVLRLDGTALSISNKEISYDSWEIENYNLILKSMSEDGESVESKYIVDYIGKDGLDLRTGDTTIRYTLEAKN